jgi:hypothetical protein
MQHVRTHNALGLGILLSALLAGSPAVAQVAFGFEDETLGPWLPATNTGSGSTGVEMHNGSMMAFARHSGGGFHGLSYDAVYAPDAVLSFQMQAVALAGFSGCCTPVHSAAGVTLSFLSAFNAPLGTMSLYNVTNTSWLGSTDLAVDSAQHDYRATMRTFAQQAGLQSSAGIAKISIAFRAIGDTVCTPGCGSSSSSVFFDSVTISAVPEGETASLLLAGLAFLGTMMRRLSSGAS